MINNKKQDGEDFRYPITVYLMRSGRPKYWQFHCPYCTAPICELDGTLIYMRDVSHNAEDANNAAVRIRCPGTNKKWCRLWFEIQLAK